jgi:hypothetical protein
MDAQVVSGDGVWQARDMSSTRDPPRAVDEATIWWLEGPHR